MFYYIYLRPLWIICLCMFVVVLVYSALGCFFLRASKAWRIINLCFSVISVLAILYVTILNRESGESEIIFIPLCSLFDKSVDVEKYRVTLMNIFLFFPLGLSMTFALPNRCKHPIFLVMTFSFLLSLVIEISQYIFRLGRCEVDDIIMNTIGAFIGAIAFMLSSIIVKNKERK